jgi:general stress protein YciG
VGIREGENTDIQEKGGQSMKGENNHNRRELLHAGRDGSSAWNPNSQKQEYP